ncbi:hypothetical protein D781_2264 [Serratia sp. FGI94]|nr:hypothetical protein D781_2264 [Serratia sp. FGI94]
MGLAAGVAKSADTDCSHSHNNYILKKSFQVIGRQGITTDGEHYFVSGTTSIEKYDKNGKMLLANNTPFDQQSELLNHFGDLSSNNGLLYLGAEFFKDGEARNLNISIYDANTLKFIKNIPLDTTSGQKEISAITVDNDNQSFWTTAWGDDESSHYVYQYAISDGRFIQRIKLSPTLSFIQGISYDKGNLFITTDDGQADKKEPDSLYRVNIKQALNQTGDNAVLQHKFTEFTDSGEIEGVNVLNDELLVLNNRGMHIEKGMPIRPYPGYKKEISEVYIYDIRNGCKIK